MMDYDLIIIGSGPGGYVAAIRAGQVGLKTAIIENCGIGGMCLNWGCIPTKALLESAGRLQLVKHAISFGVDGIDDKSLSFNWSTAVKRSEGIVKRLTKGIEYLLKKNGVEVIPGTASINADKSVNAANRLLKAKNIIIATGSRPAPLPESIRTDMKIEVDDLLKKESSPERVAIWGNSAQAVELVQFFKMAGKEAALLAEEPQLIPQADPFMSEYALKILKKYKIDVMLSAKITGIEKGEIRVSYGDKEKTLPCDLVINASNRVAVLPKSELELALENGFLKVNDDLQTPVENIYAVGDVNGICMFAHAASAQGHHAVNVISGIHSEEPYKVEHYPINIYTRPEMAQVGLSETQLKKANLDYKVSEFPLTANGKALIQGEADGIIRMLSDKKYGEVRGVQIIASHATDMIAEAGVIMQLEGTVYDVARTVHAHPTISEIFMEAGYDAFDQPIHK
jgi:dihydrolipoamide dehydrogenase